MLRERIGELEPWPLARGARGLRSCRRAEPLPQALIDAVGAEATSSPAHEDRLRHATGCGYADLARLRGGGARGGARRGRAARPTPSALRRVLDACAAEGVAVVPFGGGTSVVGGVEPLRGAHGAPDQPRPRPPCARSRSTAAR